MNKPKMKIEVVFLKNGKRPPTNQIKLLKKYEYLVNTYGVERGDILKSNDYNNEVLVLSYSIIPYNDQSKDHYSSTGVLLRKFNIISKRTFIDLEEPELVPIKSETKETTKVMKKSNMFTKMMDKYREQFIPTKAEGVRISMDGNICVQLAEGEYISINQNNELTSYPEEMCMKVPVLVISKPANQVVVGDIIHVKKSYMKVLRINKNGSLHCMSYSGFATTKTEVKDFLLNQTLVKVVFNFFNNSGANNPMAGMNPMMFMMMNKEDGEETGMEDMMQMMMISQIMGNQNGVATNNPMGQINPMMMMAMIQSEEGGKSSMLETMMMMQMMNGNPFGQPTQE